MNINPFRTEIVEITLSELISLSWIARIHYSFLIYVISRRDTHFNDDKRGAIESIMVDGLGNDYDWTPLYDSLNKHSYSPEKYGYPLLYSDGWLRDGNHRISLMALLYGGDHIVKVERSPLTKFVTKLFYFLITMTIIITLVSLPLYIISTLI